MSARERSRAVPVALVALSAFPLTVGTLGLIQLAGGPAVEAQPATGDLLYALRLVFGSAMAASLVLSTGQHAGALS
jgi:hypothetical protein